MNYTRAIAAGIAATVVGGRQAALAAGECPEKCRKLTVADHGNVMYMGDPETGTSVKLQPDEPTIEVGGRTYRVGTGTP